MLYVLESRTFVGSSGRVDRDPVLQFSAATLLGKKTQRTAALATGSKRSHLTPGLDLQSSDADVLPQLGSLVFRMA